MKDEPSQAEIDSATRKICQLFVIPEKDAADYAEGLLILMYGWGGDNPTGNLDREIKKRLSKKYDWKSEKEKMDFEDLEKLTVDTYNHYIDQKNRKIRRL